MIYDVTEAYITNNKSVFLDFYVAALCNLCITIYGWYIEQVRPLLVYNLSTHKVNHASDKPNPWETESLSP